MEKKLSALVCFSLLISWEALGLDSFSYSGRLVKADGSPVTGSVDLRFDLSSTEAPSDVLCSKTVSNIPLSQGIFNVKLAFLAADCESNTIQSIMESIPSNHNLLYKVTDLTNSRSYSQQGIYSVPSSFMANFAKSLSNLGATDGQVLMWNAATSKWIPGSAGSGDGTVTTINTGSGLIGGPIASTGTIAIAPGGVTDGHLAGAINPAKLDGTRDVSMYLRGDNSWTPFGPAVMGSMLTTFAEITGSAVAPTDNLIQGVGKLQGQISTLSNAKLDKTGGTLMVGTINGVPEPTMDDQIVNKKYVDDLVGGFDGTQWKNTGSDIYYDLGNVGIGTVAPLSQLHITEKDDTWNSSLRIDRSWDSSTDYFQMMYDYEGLKIRTMDDGDDKADIIFKPKNSEAVRIVENGNVGIGTTNPGAKLEVNGQIKITGGVPGAGKVLTSDASGLASWSDPGSSAPTGAAGGDLAGTYPNPTIKTGAITDSHIAVGAIDQSKILNLGTSLSGKQTSDADLTALAGITSTGVLVRTGDGTALTRSIVGTTNRVTVTNGSGVGGDPTINIDSSLLPSPAAGDAGKYLKASGANTASWIGLLSTDVTTALGFTPINKAGDIISTGTFTFNGSAYLRVEDPLDPKDVANKQYVDGKLSSGANQWSESGGSVYRSSGNVGIGTGTPSYPLEVNGSVKAVSFISTSDRRLKKNLQNIKGLELILLLKGVRYQWRSNDEYDIGFIAQEVEEILPDAVVTDPVSGMKAIKYQNIIPPLVESTKELYGMNTSLKEENKKLHKKIKNLEERLERLEKLLERH